MRGKIERFAWVERWLARGGQPDSAAFEALRKQGVRIIVNLRQRDGRKAVERARLRYIHIPVRNDHAPTRGQIRQWLELCSAHRRTDPIFVHCKGGEGRTSAFCAALRLAQGQTRRTGPVSSRSRGRCGGRPIHACLNMNYKRPVLSGARGILLKPTSAL